MDFLRKFPIGRVVFVMYEGNQVPAHIIGFGRYFGDFDIEFQVQIRGTYTTFVRTDDINY